VLGFPAVIGADRYRVVDEEFAISLYGKVDMSLRVDWKQLKRERLDVHEYAVDRGPDVVQVLGQHEPLWRIAHEAGVWLPGSGVRTV